MVSVIFFFVNVNQKDVISPIATTNKITVTASGLASTDKIEVDFTYNSYSDNELKEYIRAALTWMSI